MCKKLVATSGNGASTYEVTIDEQPAKVAGIDPYQNDGTSSDENDKDKRGINIPDEVKRAVLQGDSALAKSLLEQVGYTVQLYEVA